MLKARSDGIMAGLWPRLPSSLQLPAYRIWRMPVLGMSVVASACAAPVASGFACFLYSCFLCSATLSFNALRGGKWPHPRWRINEIGYERKQYRKPRESNLSHVKGSIIMMLQGAVRKSVSVEGVHSIRGLTPKMRHTELRQLGCTGEVKLVKNVLSRAAEN